MTHPTDEKLDALVKRLTDPPFGTETSERLLMASAADAITALRAKIAEANARVDRAEAERASTLSDGQRMLRKQDILTVCDTPDLCFEHDDSVARCGPCAAKLAERAGVALNQYTVSNPEAMRLRRDLNRAEAALAAQIEADARIADCYADQDYCALGYPEDGGIAASGTADMIRREIRNQPHDRTALDRIIAATRAEALRDAAKKATSFLVGDPQNGIALRNPMAFEVSDAILAMIGKPIMSGDDTGR